MHRYNHEMADDVALKDHIETSILARVDAARQGDPPTPHDGDLQNMLLNQEFQHVGTAVSLVNCQIWALIASLTDDEDAYRSIRCVHRRLTAAVPYLPPPPPPPRPICERRGCNNTCKLWRRTCGSRYCRPDRCFKCRCRIHPECTHSFRGRTYCFEHALRCDRCGLPMWDWVCGPCHFGN